MVSFTDIFCGAGGSSIGLIEAGFDLKLAMNHWDRAVETHEHNNPQADHRCADVSNYDMRALPRTDVLWASPICTEISPAGGRKRTQAQLDLLTETGDNDPGDGAFTRTRATFHDVIRATEVHRYQAVIVENVVDVARDWELFDWWVRGMRLLDYHAQFVSVSSAHIGGESNPAAPQWRDRLYIVFTRTGIPKPDVRPRPSAWCADCDQRVRAVQSWRNPKRRRIGKYRQQYDYRCPNRTCRNALVDPDVRPASQVIDWSDLGPRIGERESLGLRPLRPNTLRRIHTGLEMFDASPATAMAHSGNAVRVTKSGDESTYPPGFIAMLRKNGTATDLEAPLSTMAASGNHHALVVPYRRGAKPHTPDTPLSTVATRDQHGLMQPASEIDQCRFRMLQPREQLRAQRFPDTYTVLGTRTEQTAQAGNAVSANVACWLGQRLLTVL